MSAIDFFDEDLSGSSFAEPDQTQHNVKLLTDEGKLILRVALEGHERPTDLLLADQQAIKFQEAVNAAISRIGLDAQ